ncbi:Os03g0398482 [Oryza sativa Japonica Group]|uniref:Os03g0398482 protein n=1 Tax=Oryza sativa subsp. japonica TaxID=39947 RepID=A0A0P0VYF3_ORYSJ|nr:Os03g0398482 [Oryza sativa Japonica Group]
MESPPSWRDGKATMESPSSIPTLKCACGASATVQISNTPRNPRRRWLQCGNSGCCFLWIWEDLLNEYAEEMVAYCHAGEYDHMQETIDILRQYLDDEKNEKAKICEVLDAKENELKSTIETLNQCRLECLAMKKQLEEFTAQKSLQKERAHEYSKFSAKEIIDAFHNFSFQAQHVHTTVQTYMSNITGS